ncbi:MAG: PrsW family intramembrane metalloprotease [Bacteroidales bacterium]|nr:PrsW family intramembrane metalloprotease [Bacteroidales bacterium]
MALYIVIAAVMPAFVLLFYIYRKDGQQPEPVGQLLKGFFFGVLSVFASLAISKPLEALGIYASESQTMLGQIGVAFFGAAIPEETAKLFMLWLLLRRNPYFDEKMDGIVYAVCVGMGFAATENIMYLFQNYEDWVSVGIMRALISVPGHFAFAVLMGYYYSLVHFSTQQISLKTDENGELIFRIDDTAVGRRDRSRLLVWAAPVLAHGIFDSILMVSSIMPALSALLSIAFIFFCFRLHKFSFSRIKAHLPRQTS